MKYNKLKTKITDVIAVHPCEFLKDCLANYRDIDDSFFIQKANLTKEELYKLCNPKTRFTMELASKLEKIFGVPSGFWINAQVRWDNYQQYIKEENGNDNENK